MSSRETNVLTSHPPSESNNMKDNFASHHHMQIKCSTSADGVANFKQQTSHNVRHLVQ